MRGTKSHPFSPQNQIEALITKSKLAEIIGKPVTFDPKSIRDVTEMGVDEEVEVRLLVDEAWFGDMFVVAVDDFDPEGLTLALRGWKIDEGVFPIF